MPSNRLFAILAGLQVISTLVGPVLPLLYEKYEALAKVRREREAKEETERQTRAQARVLARRSSLKAKRSEGSFRGSSSARRSPPRERPASAGR